MGHRALDLLGARPRPSDTTARAHRAAVPPGEPHPRHLPYVRRSLHHAHDAAAGSLLGRHVRAPRDRASTRRRALPDRGRPHGQRRRGRQTRRRRDRAAAVRVLVRAPPNARGSMGAGPEPARDRARSADGGERIPPARGRRRGERPDVGREPGAVRRDASDRDPGPAVRRAHRRHPARARQERGRDHPAEDRRRLHLMSLFDLTGKNAIVTGTSAGIGNRLARTLILAGARVAAIARRTTELDDEATSTGRLLPINADLADHDQVLAAANASLEAFDGRVDVLVNNAAYIAGGVKAQDESYEIIRRTLAVNVEAPILLGQAVFPGMYEAGNGSIVNVTSITASVGIGRFPQATYAATKGGLEALTREWAAQWSRYGIRINSLVPGWIDTEVNAEVNDVPKVHDWILRNTLLPRHGQPDDFDGAVLLLASDAGRYITGQRIVVDGGWTAH